MYLADDTPDRDHDEAYLIWFHAGADPVEVELPGGPWAKGYTVIAHSGTEGELPDELIDAGHRVTLPGRIVVLMRAE
jgi:glycogen operon protein